MKKITALLLVLCIVFCLAACGESAPDDPNCGTYEAVIAKYLGIELDLQEVYSNGFSIELKNSGKCKITIDGKSASGKWTVEDDFYFTISGGGFEGEGYISEGMILLENVEDSGVDLYFWNEAYEAPAA